jgi:hypothetical protein
LTDANFKGLLRIAATGPVMSRAFYSGVYLAGAADTIFVKAVLALMQTALHTVGRKAALEILFFAA